MEIADTFAKFVTHTEFREMDPSVIDHVKKLTLKQVMGMVVGSAAPTSKKVIRYVMENSGKPECRGLRLRFPGGRGQCGPGQWLFRACFGDGRRPVPRRRNQ